MTSKSENSVILKWMMNKTTIFLSFVLIVYLNQYGSYNFFYFEFHCVSFFLIIVVAAVIVNVRFMIHFLCESHATTVNNFFTNKSDQYWKNGEI